MLTYITLVKYTHSEAMFREKWTTEVTVCPISTNRSLSEIISRSKCEKCTMFKLACKIKHHCEVNYVIIP